MILNLINSRFFLVFLFPFILGALTVFSFQPFNYSYINFFIIPALFLVTTYVKKKSKNTYRKKPYLLNLFLIGYLFGVGFFLIGTSWISQALTFDENFNFLISFSFIGLPLFLGIFFLLKKSTFVVPLEYHARWDLLQDHYQWYCFLEQPM